MPSRYHSRVFVAIAQMAADLEAADWPPHPTTQEVPTVGVGSHINPKRDETEVGEFVDVLHRVEDEGSIEWSTIQGRDERFLVDVYVRSSVLNQDRAEAWDRLAQLCEVPQSLFYVPETRDFTPPDFPGVAPLGGIARVAPQMWRTDQGWAGDCVLSFRIAARI